MNDININIGMIAPSRVGKTSLLTAIYTETQERLGVRFFSYSESSTFTKNAIENAQEAFKSCVARAGMEWIPSEIPTTSQEGQQYQFVLRNPNYQEYSINIDFVDYYGGMLGCKNFNDKIKPFLEKSNVVLVPISTDFLMEWYSCKGTSDKDFSKRCYTALHYLDNDNVCDAINEWLVTKNRNKEKAQLIFVPVKCEKWFQENSDDKDKPSSNILDFFHSLMKKININPSGALFDFYHFTSTTPSVAVFDAIKELYCKKINFSSAMAERIEISAYCVDTYGIIEQYKMNFRNNGKEDILEPQFISRNNGRLIRIKNAFELLATIVKFNLNNFQNTKQEIDYLERQKKNCISNLENMRESRPWWKKLIHYLFSTESQDIKNKRQEIYNLELKLGRLLRWNDFISYTIAILDKNSVQYADRIKQL